MNDQNVNRSVLKDDEFDLIEVAHQLWAGRKIILLTTALFVVAGGLYILYDKLTLVSEYEATVVLYVDSPSSTVVPTIITSTPLMKEVLKTVLIHPDTHQPLTVLEVLNQQQPPQGSVSGLAGRITAKPLTEMTLQISVLIQNSLLATQLLDSLLQKMSSYLVTIQTQRMQKNLQYLTDRFLNAEKAYLQSLRELSAFYDRNARNRQALDTIAVKRLRAESDLKFNIYNSLAQQIEKDRIKEQERLPVCTILTFADTPVQKNKLESIRLMFILVFSGLIVGIIAIYGKWFFNNFMENIKKK